MNFSWNFLLKKRADKNLSFPIKFYCVHKFCILLQQLKKQLHFRFLCSIMKLIELCFKLIFFPWLAHIIPGIKEQCLKHKYPSSTECPVLTLPVPITTTTTTERKFAFKSYFLVCALWNFFKCSSVLKKIEKRRI